MSDKAGRRKQLTGAGVEALKITGGWAGQASSKGTRPAVTNKNMPSSQVRESEKNPGGGKAGSAVRPQV